MRFQPIELIGLLSLDFFQGNVVKYVARHHKKGGREDLAKALHYCQLAMSYGYGRVRLPTKAQTAHIAVFVSMNSLPAYTTKRLLSPHLRRPNATQLGAGYGDHQ